MWITTSISGEKSVCRVISKLCESYLKDLLVFLQTQSGILKSHVSDGKCQNSLHYKMNS